MIVGWRCAVCGSTVDIAQACPWVCPRATADDPDHVLHLLEAGPEPAVLADDHPFVRYGPRLGWWAFARAHGMTDAACEALTHEVADGLRLTPFARSATLSAEVGRDVWVKDETGNLAGSHKARHLVTILLHLRAAELLGLAPVRAPLAIASCGNAAIAAATLAAPADWPVEVFVPDWASDAIVHRLDALGAVVRRCARRPTDPPGDPALLRFREAVAAGATPFSVQGPENGACLDGGRTIGWEIADQAAAAGVELVAAYAQVGGGAFAACLGRGLGPGVPLVAVQAAGVAPLAAALVRAAGFAHPERRWRDVMVPWPDPRSVADGILDDETYDWIAIRDALVASGGRTIVVPEDTIVRAHELAVGGGFRASPTGSAGLAGVLVATERGDRPVAVTITGIER